MLYTILMYISWFMIFANDLLVAMYLQLFQTRNDVRQKSKFERIFLFEFKMGHKAAETTHNIKTHFTNEHTVQ